MKKITIISVVCIVFLYATVLFAANNKDDLPPSWMFAANKKGEPPPPWMEDVKIKGRSTYLIPKGAKREMIGSQIIIEPPSEYVARRIYEIELNLEEHFTKIEENQEALRIELEEVKKALNKVEKEQKAQQEQQERQEQQEQQVSASQE